jgi:hypothetical protein
MIAFEPESDDSAGFFDAMVPLVNGAVEVVRPAQVYLAKVDHWFDHKWLGFSYKIGGAVGVWQREMTLPPFHPHRIRWQRHFSLLPENGGYAFDGEGEALAVEQASDGNARRYVSCRPFRSSVMAWFSGGTADFDRGALMVYTNVPSDRPGRVHTGSWYVSLVKTGDGTWRLHRNKRVGPGELAAFVARGRLSTVC